MSILLDLIPTAPTYSLQYKVGGVNRIGRQYYAEIRRRGLLAPWPTPTLLGLGDNGITVNWSYPLRGLFSRIPGGFCDVTIKETTYNHLHAIAAGDDSEWLLQVYEKDALEVPQLIFKGFIIPSTYRQEHGYHAPNVRFTATDGLGLLRNITFLEGDKLNNEEIIFPDIKGDFPIKDIISYLLSKAGNIANWRDCISYTKYPDGHFGTPRNYTHYFKRHVWDYYGKNCYVVLDDLLSILEAQVVFTEGEYRIRLPDEPHYSHYDIYSYKGLLLSSGTGDLADKDVYDDFDGGSGLLEMTGNIKNLILERKFTPWDNLIYNGDFSKGEEGWFNSGDTYPWGGVSSPMVDINEDEGYVVMKPVLESYWLDNWWKFNFPAFATSIDRGLYVGTKVRITLEVRRNTPDEYLPGFPAGHQYEINFGAWNQQPFSAKWISTTDRDEWHEIEVVVFLSTSQTDRYFCIYPTYHSFSVRNIVIVPLEPTAGEVELPDELEDDVIEINQNNRADRTYPLRYFSQDIPYRYQNVFPGGSLSTLGVMIQRSTDTYVNHYPFLRNRIMNHFIYSRVKLSGFSLFKHADSPPVNPEVVLYDRFLERTFYVINFRYNLRLARYDMELLEQQKKKYEPPSAPPWILAEGAWNDEGIWVDTAVWHDTDPN